MMLDRETDQLQAMEAAEPILPVLYRLLEESVTFYFDNKQYSDAARADHTDRAMANCIYAHAEKKMMRAAEVTPGLHSLSYQGLHVLNYKDRALIRAKKVRPNGKHSNYLTDQQRDYDDQKPFPGFPDPAFRLTAGYHLDASGSALERVMIARPIGRSIFWTAQVTMIESEARWEDITPKRFVGTEGSDFDAERARGRRAR